MPVRRSADFLLAGYALSRLSRADKRPPAALGVERWTDAYELLFDSLGGGRSMETFENSMKNVRDTFDAHIPHTPRTGWVDPDNLQAARRTDRAVGRILDFWSARSDAEVEERLLSFIQLADPVEYSGEVRTEGGMKVVVSRKVERDPKLRAEAIEVHGLDCQACGLNFRTAYGAWGEGYIEVHHLIPLSESGERSTDPRRDLAVLCSNCHRMAHRRRGFCLTLDELRQHLKAAK